MTTAGGFTSQDSYEPDRLFAGEFPRADRKVTIDSGQTLTRGAVLGKITGSGNYTLSLSGAGDGSQVPEAILAEDVDASGGDADGLIYETGDFAEDALTLGASHTIASIRDGLRDKSIFMHKTQQAAP